MTPRPLLLGGLLVGCSLVVVESGCLFAPDLESNGYTLCSVDDDCAAGRRCSVGVCAPPPWYDAVYRERRLLAVENQDDTQALAAGAAIQVPIGAGGVIPIDALQAEGRFMFYDAAQDPGDVPGAGWIDVPQFRIVEADRLLVWLPVTEPILAGEEGTLAWIQTDREDQEQVLVEDPARVFDGYETFVGAGELPLSFDVIGTGEVTVQNDVVILRRDTQLFLLEPIEPPFSLTFVMRLNGVTCQPFMGVQADDVQGAAPPYAGFLFNDQLQATLDVLPSANSGAPDRDFVSLDSPGALHRYSVEVNDGRVRLWLDDEPFAERTDLLPPMADQPYYVTVDVDGDCSLELQSLWWTRLPFDTPMVRAEDAVTFVDFQ